MLKILLHRRAEKSFDKLPKQILRKVYELVSELKANPVPWKTWDVRKIKGEKDTYRVRLDKYRLVYWVNWRKREITILKIESRKKI